MSIHDKMRAVFYSYGFDLEEFFECDQAEEFGSGPLFPTGNLSLPDSLVTISQLRAIAGFLEIDILELLEAWEAETDFCLDLIY